MSPEKVMGQFCGRWPASGSLTEASYLHNRVSQASSEMSAPRAENVRYTRSETWALWIRQIIRAASAADTYFLSDWGGRRSETSYAIVRPGWTSALNEARFCLGGCIVAGSAIFADICSWGKCSLWCACTLRSKNPASWGSGRIFAEAEARGCTACYLPLGSLCAHGTRFLKAVWLYPPCWCTAPADSGPVDRFGPSQYGLWLASDALCCLRVCPILRGGDFHRLRFRRSRRTPGLR